MSHTEHRGELRIAIELGEFQALSRLEVAQLVREAGTKVCVFPIKGTRRWFMREYSSVPPESSASAYLHALTTGSVRLYQMIFEHGIETLLSPSFSPDVMARGDSYMQMAAQGMAGLLNHPSFLDFYDACQVRVRFYGDYRKYLDPTPYAYLSNLFDEVVARTASHERHRLFMGFFAHDPAVTIARLTIDYHTAHGQIPDKRTLIELYYGEYIDPVDLFIGFGKFRSFDMPLVATGREDLYFMISPSLYLTERQLREILHDHLYVRTRTNANLSPAELRDRMEANLGVQTNATMSANAADGDFAASFYEANMERTLGVGHSLESGAWYPLPQVRSPLNSEGKNGEPKGG